MRTAPGQLTREIAQDARHALRVWRRRPLQTAFAIAVLAIAIGANTGVFSVLNALLLRSLPFREPDRLATLHMFGPPRNEFHDWRQRSAYLADATTYFAHEVNVEGAHNTRRLRLAETSWNFFSLLGREPMVGRAFTQGEDVPGRNALAVIGYGLWQQLYAGDAAAVGSRIRVNGATLTIVGIAPPAFDYPQKADLWSPTAFDFVSHSEDRCVLLDGYRPPQGGHDLAAGARGVRGRGLSAVSRTPQHGRGESSGADPAARSAGAADQDGVDDSHGGRRPAAVIGLRQRRESAARPDGRAID